MAIKVKQSTIDEIKKMGMTKALASAKTRRSPEFQEALRRMYGQRRLDAAMKGAAGGSASRETYMKRGYSARPTSSGKSAPVKKGGGQGYAAASKPKPRSRAGAVAAGVAGAAGAGVAVKGTMEKRKIAAMTARQRAAYLKERAEKTARRGAPITKFAQSKGGKLVGKAARLATGKTAAGAAMLYGASKFASAASSAAKETEKRRKAGMKDTSVGGSRATAIKKSTQKSTRKMGRMGSK